MIVLALTIALLASQAGGDTLFPYLPIVSQSSVRATATGEVACSISINGERQPDQGCGFASGAPDGLRRMRRDADLTMIFAILPEGAASPDSGADFGELIVEGRARLSIAVDGSVARCERRVERIIRQVAGVRSPPEFCKIYAVGQRLFVAAEQPGPRTVEMSALVYLREGARP